jgi:hypothetical protein
MIAVAITGAACSGGAGSAVPPSPVTAAGSLGATSKLVKADAIMQAATPKDGVFQLQSGTLPQGASVAIPASATRSTQSQLQGNQWTQISAGVQYITMSPDGSVWGISSTITNFADGLVIHYVNNAGFSVFNGFATRISIGPDGTPYVVQSNGKVYVLRNGVWTVIGCCASDISVASDGSL